MPAMHVAIIASKQGGKTYYSKLLRRSFRDESGKVQKKTLANLSSLSDETIALVRGSLAGKQYVEASDAFEILRSRKHGPVAAIAAAFERLGMIELIGSEPCRERDLVCAMIAARIIRPHSKLATTRWRKDTALGEMFGVDDAEVDELYAAMDWLGKRQNRIQGKLARRHFRDGGLVLFDLTSSYFEGTTCPLGRLGHDRDGKKGKLQVNFGLLCDVGGCPVSVLVYAGNIGDPKTLLPEVARLQKRFGLQRVAIVGDRGMIAQTRITELKKLDGVDWITALKSATIQKLIRSSSLDVARFDEVNLFEVLHPDYPGERLVACRNPRLAARRAHTRDPARSRRTLAACQTQGRRMARGWLRNPLLPNPDRKPGNHYPKYIQDPARPAGYQSRARNLRYGHNADQIPNKGDGVAGNHSRPKTQTQPGRTQNVGRKSDF